MKSRKILPLKDRVVETPNWEANFLESTKEEQLTLVEQYHYALEKSEERTEYLKEKFDILGSQCRDLRESKSKLRKTKSEQAVTIIEAYKKQAKENYEKALNSYISEADLEKALKIAAGL